MFSRFSAATSFIKNAAEGAVEGAVSIAEKGAKAAKDGLDYIKHRNGPPKEMFKYPSADKLKLYGPNKHFFVEIIECCNIPRSYVMGDSDPYVMINLLDKNDAVKGRPCATLWRRNTNNPKWYAYRDLFAEAEPDDHLLLELWERHLVIDDVLIGTVKVPVEKLSEEEKDFVVVLAEEYKLRLVEGGGAQPPGDRTSKSLGLNEKSRECSSHFPAKCVISLRRVAPPTFKKTLFFLRHGESKWNKARTDNDYKSLLAFDHGLNKFGVDQALVVNQKWQKEKKDPSPRVEQFLSAELIYSSPLTRACQTALVALHGHPAHDENGIILLRNAREIKSIGGIDTVGKAIGNDIIVRVQKELTDVIGEEKASTYMCPIELYDTTSSWWTPGNEFDTEIDIGMRFYDFMCTMKYSKFQNSIVVCHSHFIREFCRRYIPLLDKGIGDDVAVHGVGSSSLEEDSIVSIAQDLHDFKLENCGILAADVDFSGPPVVASFELMFGTKMSRSEKMSKSESV